MQSFFHQHYDTPSTLSEQCRSSSPHPHCTQAYHFSTNSSMSPAPCFSSTNHCTPHAWRGAPSFICSASFSKSRIQSNTSLNNTAGLKALLTLALHSNLTFSRGLPRDVHGTVGYQGFAASIQVKKQLQQQVKHHFPPQQFIQPLLQKRV